MNQKVDMIGNAADLHEDAALLPQDAAQVVVQTHANGLGQEGFAMFGAEYDVDQEIGEGVGHGFRSLERRGGLPPLRGLKCFFLVYPGPTRLGALAPGYLLEPPPGAGGATSIPPYCSGQFQEPPFQLSENASFN